MFDGLQNLEFLNLSANYIEVILTFSFSNLIKLTTIDLSQNRIYYLNNYSFNSLTSLKNLHLNNNIYDLKMEINTLFRIISIQNIYISKSVLLSSKSIFINLASYKNRMSVRKVKNTHYFKSLFLMTPFESNGVEYDCNLTLYFIRFNMHLNFKTESDISNYFSECNLKLISKNTPYYLSAEVSYSVLSNGLFYFFILSLLAILCFVASYLKIGQNKVQNNNTFTNIN